MKKYVSLLCMLLLIVALAASCGAKKSSKSEANDTQKEAVTEKASGPVTFKEAVEEGGSKMWYLATSLEGRNTELAGAFYIDKGQMTSLFVRSLGDYNLGTLEEYYSLSDEEALALAQEKYKAAYKKHYALFDEDEPVIQDMKENPARYTEPEEQIAAWEKVKERITNYEPKDVDPAPYEFVMSVDETGNNTSSEAIKTTFSDDLRAEGFLEEVVSYELHKVIEPTKYEAFINAEESVSPFEVYDSFYGGYAYKHNNNTAYFITKCSQGSEFILDEPGTEGITITN